MHWVPLPLRALLLAALASRAVPVGLRDARRDGVAAGHEAPFRTSLTATVIIGPTAGGGKHDRTAALGCRDVLLRWAELEGARRFVVQASARADGPWAELPATNVCGAVRRPSPTQLVDVEPTRGAPAVLHRLYYKVVALGATAPGAAPLDVTEPVLVELP